MRACERKLMVGGFEGERDNGGEDLTGEGEGGLSALLSACVCQCASEGLRGADP